MVNTNKYAPDLLEYLAFRIGAMYLSDLHNERYAYRLQPILSISLPFSNPILKIDIQTELCFYQFNSFRFFIFSQLLSNNFFIDPDSFMNRFLFWLRRF